MIFIVNIVPDLKLLCKYITDFAIPSQLKTEPKNPHCIKVTWKKVADPVTGYRIYCYPTDSHIAEIIKEIPDVNQESVIISGLKPARVYRVGITSVSYRDEGKLLFSENEVRLRKSIFYNFFCHSNASHTYTQI